MSNSNRHIRLTEAERIARHKSAEDMDLICSQRIERSRKRRVTKWQRGSNLQRMQAAVKRVRVHGESISGVALRTGLPERTLRRYCGRCVISISTFVNEFRMDDWVQHVTVHETMTLLLSSRMKKGILLTIFYCTDMLTSQKMKHGKTIQFSSVPWLLMKSCQNTSERTLPSLFLITDACPRQWIC